jgi:hypothetical protein
MGGKGGAERPNKKVKYKKRILYYKPKKVSFNFTLYAP